MNTTRILMTADAVGGVWRYAMDLGRELHDRGTQVTLAVMGPPPSDSQRDEAHQAGLDVVDRPYRLEWMEDPWADVELAGRWLLGLARDLSPSIVHLNGYAHAALPWPAPVTVVAHSCVGTWWQAVHRQPAPPTVNRYREAVMAGFGAADAVIAPTKAMASALSDEYGMRASTIQIIPNGSRAASAEPVGAAGKASYVLAAGRMWDDAKNVKALCAIADSIDWPILVAGDVEGYNTANCEVSGVHLLGRLSAAAIRHRYRRASIYALPARYEPFGLSVLEAAAAGCALVLGDIPSLRENWCGAAAFVAPDDHAALASTLRELIADRNARIDLGRRAAARSQMFSATRMADGYTQVYRSLLT